MISISLSPNVEKDDIKLALKLIFSPWKWKKGGAPSRLEEEFKNYLGVKYVFAFNSGRSSLMALLKSLGLSKGDKILIQAFTCNAAVNPILWSGFEPVYVDCDENFNIDVENLRRKITPETKVLIVQNTFGLPAQMDKILEIVKERNLILIEDCAHCLGAEFQGKKIGTFGRASFFSFSRDKIISSVYGGIAATSDENLAEKIKTFQEETSFPSNCWIFQQLLHPILITCLVLPFYSILGKYLLVAFQQFRILSKAVHQKEKKGEKPSYFPGKMPNVLAELALNQFKKLEKFNNHRRKIASYYHQVLKNSSFKLPLTGSGVFLRFPIRRRKAHKIIREAWNENLLLGDWYTSPVAPYDTNLEKVRYRLGTCPKAEEMAETTLNLPTNINITLEKAEKIVKFLKKY